MTRLWTVIGRTVILVLAATSVGCQAQHMVDTYASFDALVADIYEKHVLQNLARRDRGRTMIQMNFHGFSANLNYSTSLSGKVQFFANSNVEGADGSTISLQAFRQSFEPNVGNSVSSGLNISSGPAPEQHAVRALYDEQVARIGDDRIFHRTTSALVALRSYCYIRTSEGEIYYVPQHKAAEFADFVHRVCFYRPEPPKPAPPAPPPPPPAEAAPPAKAPTTAPATRPAKPRADRPNDGAALLQG